MSTPPLSKADTLASLPEEWSSSLLPDIRQQVIDSQRTVVVLDDDPTGTQTVYDLPVLTTWSIETLEAELSNNTPIFYILTNSRSLPLVQAQALNKEIATNLSQASQNTGRDFTVISRSDSTLRGHYPGEVDALVETLGQAVDATLIIPFFLEGGRYTIHDTHYVAEGETLIPAAETPFAQDAAFGYQASNLCEWVAEKTAGRVSAETVASISVADLREGGPDVVANKLIGLENGRVCVINAASMRDLEVFTLGLLTAEGQGKQFVYRTAASFVQVRAGLAPKPLLTQADLDMPITGGGLVIVGSYVPKTTSQLQVLLEQTNINRIEIDVSALLDDDQQASEIMRCVKAMNEALRSNEDVVLYTSRKLISANDAEQSLAIGNRVSDSLVSIVQSLQITPRYLIAKGGITSSDIATKGLGVKRAAVMGQILPGIPLWTLGEDSQHPGLPYIVFPGNVGGDDAVATVVKQLQRT
ncbi:MAG: four-carbon acid sugar kinase family protein [Chloroflexota bacterium]